MMDKITRWLLDFPAPLFDRLYYSRWLFDTFGIQRLRWWDRVRYYIVIGEKWGIKK